MLLVVSEALLAKSHWCVSIRFLSQLNSLLLLVELSIDHFRYIRIHTWLQGLGK